MSINTIYPIPYTTTAVAPNGQMYQQTNSGKIIGGTIGAIAGYTNGIDSGIITAGTNAALWGAIGTGIGAAVDYLRNKQREEIANSVNINPPTPNFNAVA